MFVPDQPLITKNRRGRPPTGIGTLVGVRLSTAELTTLDAWIAAQPEPRPSRPEALRRLAAAQLGADDAALTPGQILILGQVTALDLWNAHPEPKPAIADEVFPNLVERCRRR